MSAAKFVRHTYPQAAREPCDEGFRVKVGARVLATSRFPGLVWKLAADAVHAENLALKADRSRTLGADGED